MSSSSPEHELARTLAAKAREDLEALRALHERGGIADAILGFHAQQAVEKALKALLECERSPVGTRRGQAWGRLVEDDGDVLERRCVARTEVGSRDDDVKPGSDGPGGPERLDRTGRPAHRKHDLPSMAFYVVAVALAFLAPQVAAFGYLLIAVAALFRRHGDHNQAEA